MARSFTFNGKTILTPGAISRVRTIGSAGSAATNGIVALLGEADGGEPGAVVTFDDPNEAIDYFTSGPLADAAKIAFDPSSDPRVPGGCFRAVCYKTNQGTQAETQLPSDDVYATGSVDAASTAAVIVWVTTPAPAVNAYAGMWLSVASGEKRRIVSNTATTATVSPAFSTIPATASTFNVLQSSLELTSVDYGVHTNQIAVEVEAGVGTNTSVVTISKGTTVEQSGDLGGSPVLEMMYLGGPIPLQGAAGAAATGIEVDSATTTTVTTTFATAPTASQYDGMILEFSGGLRRLIASHTETTTVVFTISGTPLSAAEAVAVVGQDITVRAVTAATASIVGSAGVATSMTSTITMSPVSALDNLSLTFAAGETLQEFITRVNAGGKYLLEVPSGVNANTFLMKEMDFGTRATAVDIRYDHEVSYADKGTFRADLQAVVDWINDTSELVTAVRVGMNGGAELPAVTGGAASTVADTVVYLVGGTRGTSTNTNWQDGHDALLEVRANHMVPLISYDLADDGFGSTATFASVAAQAASFADEANDGTSVGSGELGVYIGMDGTLTELQALTNTTNNPNVHIFGQKLTVLDPTGTLVEKPEWSAAVQAAGMRAGLPDVGEPLTFKKIKCVGISNDTSWSTKSISDRNACIESGIMFAEEAPNGGFRWVRDITSYIGDDTNGNFIEGSVRDATRYVVYDLRTAVAERFTGEARAATVTTIRELVTNKLGQYYRAGILVDSNDPEDPNSTELIPGFRRVKVSISGNTANIKAEIFVLYGVVFEGLDISVQVPQISG